MSLQNYAVIDSSNNIIGVVLYPIDVTPPNPEPNYPNHTLIPCGSIGLQQDGWTYVDGQFIAPPPQPVPEPLPSATPTLSDLQAQMAILQAHMSTLLAQS